MKNKLTIAAIAATMIMSTACNNNGSQSQFEEIDTSSVITLITSTDVLEQVLNARHSVRQYEDSTITHEQLLRVMWAANGINREDGSCKRTAPSAVNAQDIELYALLADGAYHYQPMDSTLVKISDNDVRPIIAGRNEFILNQATILLCSDQSKFDARFGERAMTLGTMDAGYVSQNVCLYCAAAGLATVPCAPPIDAAAVQKALGLSSSLIPLIYHPIGYERMTE